MAEQGQGDYTCDRERWQLAFSVDSLADAIDAWKQAGQDKRVLLRMLKQASYSTFTSTRGSSSDAQHCD